MKKIVIDNVRNIVHLEFIMPEPGVSIITGKNGSGKTSLFTCINRIYDRNAFRKGFPASNVAGLDIFSGSVTYYNDIDNVEYTKRRNGEWRPNKKNDVLRSFNYPLVINITTNSQRIFLQDEIIPRGQRRSDPWMNDSLNTIFSTRKFSNMVRITTGNLRGNRGNAAENRRRNTAYAIPLRDGNFYTERNFSFGEIVLINLLYDIQNAPNGSLILIDEVELALHPSAQVNLVSCLRELANQKDLTIIISTHSASIIRSESHVILLEQQNGHVEVLYKCPPAKSIGAIGMREDTMPDKIILVEDSMAKCMFRALLSKFNALEQTNQYLDIRILAIGDYKNVLNFYLEAKNYIFYRYTQLAIYLDKDVETDVIPYPQYGNNEFIQSYAQNRPKIKFLPYTPEVLLMHTFTNLKTDLLRYLRQRFNCQPLNYDVTEELDFARYNAQFPQLDSLPAYNVFIQDRASFRRKCKGQSEIIVTSLSDQLNESPNKIYEYVFCFVIDNYENQGINVRALLGPIMHN